MGPAEKGCAHGRKENGEHGDSTFQQLIHVKYVDDNCSVSS